MARKATLSVLIPNYNHGHYLEEYVNGVLSQSRPPDEVIIIDDGSKDNSLEVIQKLARQSSRIRWFQNEKNMGCMPTLTRALHLATSEYCYGGAADDRVLPGTFEKAMAQVEQHPEAGLCFGFTLSLNHQTGEVSENSFYLTDTPKFLTGDELADVMDRAAIPAHAVDVPGNASVWKRTEHMKAGGYRPNLRWHADWFSLQVTALRCGACFIPEPFAVTRIDHSSFCWGGRQRWDEQKAVLENILALLRSPDFADVLPRFQKGKLLSQLAPWVVRVIVGQPKYWDKDNALLIENSLLHFCDEHINDPDPVVREGTCVCLGHLGAKAHSVLDAVKQRETDLVPAVRRAALKAHAAIAGGSKSLTWPIQHAARESGYAARGAVRRAAGLVRPLAAAAYKKVNYRLYARMRVFEESLEALIREHAGQIDRLKAEAEEIRRQMHAELEALRAQSGAPVVLQIARQDGADNGHSEQHSTSDGVGQPRRQAA